MKNETRFITFAPDGKYYSVIYRLIDTDVLALMLKVYKTYKRN